MINATLAIVNSTVELTPPFFLDAYTDGDIPSYYNLGSNASNLVWQAPYPEGDFASRLKP